MNCSLGQLGRLGDQSLDLKNERDAQTGLSPLVVCGRFIQFALGQRIERNSHALQAGPCVAEYGFCRTRRQGTRLHSLISTRGLFDPEVIDLFPGEALQTHE